MTESAPARRPTNAPGTPVRNARLARKATLATVAGRCGISLGFLSQIEMGKSEPSLGTARKLARFYETTIDALFPELPAEA